MSTVHTNVFTVRRSVHFVPVVWCCAMGWCVLWCWTVLWNTQALPQAYSHLELWSQLHSTPHNMRSQCYWKGYHDKLLMSWIHTEFSQITIFIIFENWSTATKTYFLLVTHVLNTLLSKNSLIFERNTFHVHTVITCVMYDIDLSG